MFQHPAPPAQLTLADPCKTSKVGCNCQQMGRKGAGGCGGSRQLTVKLLGSLDCAARPRQRRRPRPQQVRCHVGRAVPAGSKAAGPDGREGARGKGLCRGGQLGKSLLLLQAGQLRDSVYGHRGAAVRRVRPHAAAAERAGAPGVLCRARVAGGGAQLACFSYWYEGQRRRRRRAAFPLLEVAARVGQAGSGATGAGPQARPRSQLGHSQGRRPRAEAPVIM